MPIGETSGPTDKNGGKIRKRTQRGMIRSAFHHGPLSIAKGPMRFTDMEEM